MSVGGRMNIVGKYKRKNKIQEYPSLYDVFELGDRVKRIYKDINGTQSEFKGIVLAIDANSIEIYWDTRNGKYRPNDMNIGFTNCSINEIFTGTKEYSPIEKDIKYY
jgi:hypothetical protein